MGCSQAKEAFSPSECVILDVWMLSGKQVMELRAEPWWTGLLVRLRIQEVLKEVVVSDMFVGDVLLTDTMKVRQLALKGRSDLQLVCKERMDDDSDSEEEEWITQRRFESQTRLSVRGGAIEVDYRRM